MKVVRNWRLTIRPKQDFDKLLEIPFNDKNFLQFVLNVHGFNNPTKLGNMSFKTNAEIMARFVLGQPDLPDEPHTALEDIIYYELPIFCALAKKMSKKDLQNSKPYNWRACQVRDFYRVK